MTCFCPEDGHAVTNTLTVRAGEGPELVAQHYTAAGCAEQAVAHWQRAGQHASDRSAYLEAVSHFTTGIALLKTLSETPEHTQHSLTLHISFLWVLSQKPP